MKSMSEMREFARLREVKEALSMETESRAVVAAFEATKINDSNEADIRELMDLSKKVKECSSDFVKVRGVIGSELGRKYAAAKLRELADLLDQLN